jgi:hypothetical protein
MQSRRTLNRSSSILSVYLPPPQLPLQRLPLVHLLTSLSASRPLLRRIQRFQRLQFTIPKSYITTSCAMSAIRLSLELGTNVWIALVSPSAHGLGALSEPRHTDYDLCTSCMDNGCATEHNPFHSFLEIKEPGRVIIHTVLSGDGELDATHGAGRNSARAPQNPSPAQVSPPPAAHSAYCDLCDSAIFGVRFVCALPSRCWRKLTTLTEMSRLSWFFFSFSWLLPVRSCYPCRFRHLRCVLYVCCMLVIVTLSAHTFVSITKDQHPKHGFVRISNTQDLIVSHLSHRELKFY